MADPAKIVMYVENTFDKRNPGPDQLQAMQQAATHLGECAAGADFDWTARV
jgi:hypothetical protein